MPDWHGSPATLRPAVHTEKNRRNGGRVSCGRNSSGGSFGSWVGSWQRADTLYAAWEMYCKQTGRKVTTVQMFDRDLWSAVPGIKRRRSTGFAPFYEGIAITAETAAALQRFQKPRSREADE